MKQILATALPRLLQQFNTLTLIYSCQYIIKLGRRPVTGRRPNLPFYTLSDIESTVAGHISNRDSRQLLTDQGNRPTALRREKTLILMS